MTPQKQWHLKRTWRAKYCLHSAWRKCLTRQTKSSQEKKAMASILTFTNTTIHSVASTNFESSDWLRVMTIYPGCKTSTNLTLFHCIWSKRARMLITWARSKSTSQIFSSVLSPWSTSRRSSSRPKRCSKANGTSAVFSAGKLLSQRSTESKLKPQQLTKQLTKSMTKLLWNNRVPSSTVLPVASLSLTRTSTMAISKARGTSRLPPS